MNIWINNDSKSNMQKQIVKMKLEFYLCGQHYYYYNTVTDLYKGKIINVQEVCLCFKVSFQ